MLRLLTFFVFLFFTHCAGAQFQGLIVNEFSQGNSSSREYIEILVVGNHTCTDSTADIRGWIVDDQNGWYGTTGITPGHYRFRDIPSWSAVPFGSIILLYNSASGEKNLSITLPDDPSDANKDFTYILPINSNTYLEEHNSQPNSTSTPSYVYPAAISTAGYTGTSNLWIGNIALNNTGDVISLISPSNRSMSFFAVGYGFLVNAGFLNPSVSIPSVGAGNSAYLSSSSYNFPGDWVIGAVPAGETPGQPNGGANTTWVAGMRQGRPEITLSTTASPVCASNTAQHSSLSFSSPVNAPVFYHLTWSASAPNGFDQSHGALSNGIGFYVPAGAPLGTYTGYITVSNLYGVSCIDTFTVTVLPLPSAPQLTVVQPTCTEEGIIQIISPAGTEITYSIDGVNYSHGVLFNNVSPGSYTVTAKNAAGCVSPGTNVVINPSPETPPVPTVNVTQPACGAANAGSIVVSAPTGAGFTYSVDGTNFQAATSFTGLTPGNYTVTVKNSVGCTAGTPVAIAPAAATPPVPTVTVVNQCDGTSTLTATGVTGNLLWSNGATNNPLVVTSAGTYTVTQTVNGCASGAGSAVAAPGNAPPVPILTVVQPSCTLPTGSIAITSPLGSIYVYSINGSSYTAVTRYDGLIPGNYTISVWNIDGCTSTASVAIQPPPPPASPIVTIFQPDCVTATGSILVTAPVAGYSYSINGLTFINTSGSCTGLTSGTYFITAKNSEGCVSIPTQAIINQQPFTPLVQVNSPDICPGATATLSAAVFPAGNYTYVWTVPAGAPNPGNVASFASNVAGAYSVIVTHSDGCSATASGLLSINNLATVMADDKQLCTGAVVTLTGQPAGGVWSGAGVSGSQFDATGLTPGNYSVTYTYTSASCSGSANAIIAVKAFPAAPNISVANQCNGTSVLTASNFSGSLLWNTGAITPAITVNMAENYMLTQTVEGCTSPAAIAFANPLSAPAAPMIISVQQPDCSNPMGNVTVTSAGTDMTYSILSLSMISTTGQFTNLPTGVHSITALNSDGCVSSPMFVNIQPAPAIPPPPAMQVVHPGCSGIGGSISVQSPTGAGLTYSIDGTNYQLSPVFTNLSPGNYSVQVRSGAGCVSPAVAVQILSASGTILRSITACIAEGDSYNLNGQVLTTTGNYSTIYVRPNSCDSIVRLYLLVARTARQEFTGCGRVTYNGNTYFSSATLRDTVKSLVTNCDSLYRVTQITVYPVPVSSITVCLPAGQSYNFNGQVLTNSGHYAGTFSTAAGCDSTVHLLLTIASRQIQNLSACGAVTVNGVTYTKDTTLTVSIPSLLTNCDSVIHLTNIIIKLKPNVVITGGRKICKGETVQLHASANNATVEWLGFGPGNDLLAAPSVTTTYTAVATSSAGCADSADVTINVDDFNLEIIATPNPVIAGKTTVLKISATSPYNIIGWQPSFSMASATQQIFVADTSQMVWVWARSRSGCTDSAFVHVLVDPLGDVYIPSAFTPNNDGNNDWFLVAGGNIIDFNLKVFNRWGQLVFYSSQRTRGWDGATAGIAQPPGIYVYALSATLKNGRKVIRKGTVTLIR